MKATTDTVKVVALTNPFSGELLEASAAAGLSIRELAGDAASDQVLAFLNGNKVAYEDWDRVLVRDEDFVNFISLPAGSGGPTDILRIVAVIAIAVFAAWAAPALAGAMSFGSVTFWQAATFTAGMLAVNMLIPPPMPKLGGGNEPDKLNSLTGSRNGFAPYGPVPNGYGTNRAFPPFASLPYTEIVGNDQYFNALYCIGLGEYEILPQDIKIGETEALDYEGAEVTMTDQPTFPSIVEEQLGLTLEQDKAPPLDGEHVIRTSSTGAKALSVDLSLPMGLVHTDKEGDRSTARILVRVEYRAVGSGTWLNVRNTDWQQATHGTQQVLGEPNWNALDQFMNGMWMNLDDSTTFTITGRSNDGKRVGVKWSVPEGQYEVRVTRVSTARLDGGPQWKESSRWSRFSAMLAWTALRTYQEAPAVTVPPGEMTFLRVRLRANDRLSGVVDSLNVIATRKLPAWTPLGGWTAPSTANASIPAWAAADIAKGLGNARPLTDAQLDLPAFAAWASETTTKNYTYNEVLDYKTSVFEALRRAASVGRAAVSNRNGKWTIVLEDPTATPVQYFTPRNSKNFSASKRFFEIPHGLKIRFISAQADYQEDEIVVYDDGYSEANATRFETLELKGITDADYAWKTGRYHLAALRLRPEVYSFGTDVEHVVCQRGDIIRVAHDIPMWGRGTARIKSINGNVITLDEKLEIGSTANLVMRIRKNDASYVLLDVTSSLGLEIDTFTRTATREGTYSNLNVDDLVMLGTLGADSANLVVLAVQPGTDLSAEITAVDAAPEILNADTGPIPPYNPNISSPVNPMHIPPPRPYNVQAWSGNNLLKRLGDGTVLPRMLVTWDYPSSGLTAFPGTTIMVRYREGELDTYLDEFVYGDYKYVEGIPAADGSVSIPDVEFGLGYSIQLMAISRAGGPSGFTQRILHVAQAVTEPVEVPPAPVADAGPNKVKLTVTFPPDWDATENNAFLEFGRGLINDGATVFERLRVPVPHAVTGQTFSGTFLLDDLDPYWYFVRRITAEDTGSPWSGGVQAAAFASSARYISIIAEGQIFSYNNSTGTPVLIGPAAIDFAVQRNGLTGAVTWQAWNAQGVEITPVTNVLTLPGGDNLTATMSATNFAAQADNEHITIRATSEGLFDEVTVVELMSGRDGTAGDAIVGVLTNESHVEPANADGSGVTPGNAGGTFKVWDGVSDVTGAGPVYSIVGGADAGATWNKTQNGLRMTINETTGVYSLDIPSAWTSEKETFTLEATYGGVTIPKTYSISKSRSGAAGATWYSDSGAPAGALGVIDDFYIDTATGNYYKKTGASTWTLQADLSGDPGAVWHTGAGTPLTGLGVIGDFYINATNGDYYEKTGAATWTLSGNLKGADGASWYSGTGAPSGALGVIDDFYIDTATGNYYKKTGASTWTLQADLSGDPGAVWHTGAGAPAGALGVIGDFYINSTNGDYYEKTGASAWTLRGNLKGTKGDTGTPGDDGYPLNLTPSSEFTYPIASTMGGWNTLYGNSSNAEMRNDIAGPHGGYPLIIRTFSVATLNTWVYAARYTFPVDPNRAYITYAWVARKTAGSRSVYCGWTTTTGYIMNLAGIASTNAYFVSGAWDVMTVGKWYLAVGVISPMGTTVSTNLSGLYDPATGTKVMSGLDFRHHDSAPTTQWVRLGYHTTSAGQTVADGISILPAGTFMLDGAQPTIEQLLRRVAGQGTLATASEITMANLAAGLQPIEIVTSLPATGNYAGRVVFLTTDFKLYRHAGTPTDATGFSKAVDGSDLVLDSVTASKISVAQLSALASIVGQLATRTEYNSNPVLSYQGDPRPRVLLSDGNSPLSIQDATDSEVFGVSVEGSSALVSLRGALLNDDSNFMGTAAVNHLRNRLGIELSGVSSGGERYRATTPEALVLSSNRAVTAGTDPFIVATTSSLVFSCRITDFREYEGSINQNFTAPVYRIYFRRNGATISGGGYPSAGYFEVAGTAYNIDATGGEPQVPPFWQSGFNIDRTVNFSWSPPLAGTGATTYEVYITRVSGSSYAPSLRHFSVSQAIVGGGTAYVPAAADFKPPISVLGASRSITASDANGIIYKSNTGTYTLTLVDSAFEPGHSLSVQHSGTSGTITIARGTGVSTLWWLRGDGNNPVNANRTLNKGGAATIVKIANGLWHIYGTGIT